MPRSTNPDDYGPEYPTLLQRAFAESATKPFRLPLPEGSPSAGLARKLYAYFNSLKASPDHAKLAEMAKLMTLRAEPGFVVFIRKRNQWDAQAIRAGLGLEEGFADLGTPIIPEAFVHVKQAPTAASPLSKLQEIRSKRTKR